VPILFLILASIPAPDTRVVQIHDLATLTADQAQHLNGRVTLFRVELDSTEYEGGYECVTHDDISRTAYFLPEQEVGDRMVVEARLVVLRHGKSVGADGTIFPGLVE
jgi:hypothetical protein